MRIREYREKPRVKFWGSDDYYLGMELEVEAPNLEARQVGIKPIVWGLHAKHDGSLNAYGVELITHPFARSLWLEPAPKKGPVQKFLKLVGTLRDLHYQSHGGGRCGLHLHVCRKAFGPKLGSHYYWFSRLVNGGLFTKLSQRTELNQWCAQKRPTIVRENGYRNANQRPLAVATNRGNRYVALNVTSNTIEVRIFRGNLREARIRKAVEAVVAAIEFARTRSSRNWKEDLDQAFIAYALRNRRVYPNLAAYLKEIGMVPSVEDREEVEEPAAV